VSAKVAPASLQPPKYEYVGRAPCGHVRAICGIWTDAQSAKSAARFVKDCERMGFTVEVLPRAEACAEFTAGLDCACAQEAKT
jgi:hypothetical protein